MNPKIQEILDSFYDRPGKCGFVTQIEDVYGSPHRCLVRYDRRITHKSITISNITVHIQGTDITDGQAVQDKIKAIEARCMVHAEQDIQYADTLLQTFQH